MKRIAIFALVLLQGCGAYQCYDAKVVRPVVPIEREFNVQLEFQGQKMNAKISCEKYYDAMCAERGNFWSIRETGRKSEYQRGQFEFYDPELGKIEFPYPLCMTMAEGKKEPLAHFVPIIGGEAYWLIASDGDMRTYRSSKKKLLKIKLSVSVDGIRLE